MVVLSHLDLVCASQSSKYVQANPIETPVPLSIMQPEDLSGLQNLQENLGGQGANELLTNLFNIVRKKNSHSLEVRLQGLEESFHNAYFRKNKIQKVASRKTRVDFPELAGTKKDEDPRPEDRHKSRKHQTLAPIPGRDWSSHAPSLDQAKTHPGGGTKAPVVGKNTREQDPKVYGEPT